MQLLEISVLAQFAISASALAVSESPISLIKARATPVASTTAYLPEPSPSPIGYHSCSGYWTWSPSEWANFWKGDAAPLGTCVDNKPNNSDGTDIHVSKGCIVINDSPRCQSSDEPYNVSDGDITHHVSSAVIYAKFDGDKASPKVTPGCKLQPRWPGAWTDLQFTDNCLTDPTGVWSECCTDDTVNTESVINPYFHGLSVGAF